MLFEPGKCINAVYFPTTGFISLIVPIDISARLEVGLVGDEGVLGTPLILGVDHSPLQSQVQACHCAAAGQADQLSPRRRHGARSQAAGGGLLQLLRRRHASLCAAPWPAPDAGSCGSRPGSERRAHRDITSCVRGCHSSWEMRTVRYQPGSRAAARCRCHLASNSLRCHRILSA